MAFAPSSIHLVDDRDLDDAELWAVIDSAAASRSSCRRKPLLALQNGPPNATPVPHCPNGRSGKIIPRNPNFQRVKVEEVRTASDGEVVQEEQWNHHRPTKMARYGDYKSGRGDQLVYVRHPSESPTVSPLSPSSEGGRFSMQGINPPMEATRLDFRHVEDTEDHNHGLAGRFPSVTLFKQYQNAALSILEKGDYTMISGNPFIKKTGWRKIALFFNISFEIKDKSIEYDENRNVIRAEFVIRAFMRGGRFSDGWGSCERREKRFSKPNHDIPSTAETRAKNKACQDLVGIGDYRHAANSSPR
ncbi:peptide transporter family protein [Wolffia australiana]